MKKDLLTLGILMYLVGVFQGYVVFNDWNESAKLTKLSKICAIIKADSDYIDNDSELYKACEGI